MLLPSLSGVVLLALLKDRTLLDDWAVHSTGFSLIIQDTHAEFGQHSSINILKRAGWDAPAVVNVGVVAPCVGLEAAPL
jgi:hypothetical protein